MTETQLSFRDMKTEAEMFDNRSDLWHFFFKSNRILR